MELTDIKAKIYFCLREKLYNSMLVTCKEALKLYFGEITLNLYHALALNLNGRLTECIKELEVIKNENDIRLASIVALIYTHKKIEQVDKATFSELEGKLRELRKSATLIDFCNAAFVLYSFRKYDKALDYIEKALKINRDSIEALTLKGWITLNLPFDQSFNTVQIFETCLKDTKRHLDPTVGLAEAYLHSKNHADAVNTINKCVVRFPSSNIPLICKAKILFCIQDYEQAVEVINRVLATDDKSYVVIKLLILILICKESDYELAANHLSKFIAVIDIVEPKNGMILYDNGYLFSRLCNRFQGILTETHKMLEKAVMLDATNIEFLNELGYQCLLQGKIKDALKCYKTASKTDNTSFNALLGMTLCELADNGKSDQIKQQIFFLLELQDNKVNPMLLFMRANLADDMESVIQLLEEAFSEQLKPIMLIPYGEQYLRLLDPDFLLDVLKVYLQFAPSPDVNNKQTLYKPNNIIINALNTLKIISKACPGLEEAQFLLGQVQFLKGDNLNAMKTLMNLVTEINSASGEAHLLIAQIHMKNNSFERASQSLEAGLSHNFKVRENPMYHLIQGLIEKNRKHLDEAIKSLTVALSLVDVKLIDSSYNRTPSKVEITLADKATIYLELIDAHKQANQFHEATKFLEDAIDEFENTSEESRIMILSADFAAATDDVHKAIDILSRVKPNESYYLKAKTKLAEIFLIYRQDKKAFMRCYHEMVQFNTTPESFLLLGDAYMKILEPDKALEAYNNALQMNPSDPYLTTKMGKALIETHYYKKAVVYYKNTIALTDNPDLKLQLAELYMQLKEYDKSEMMLTAEINHEKSKNTEDLLSLQYLSKLYNLKAEVNEKSGNIKNATEALKLARDNQNRVRKILTVEQAVVPEEEINYSVQINMKLAELASTTRENERAINHYKDALSISSENPKILAALAKLYMQMNYLELCQQTCTNLLKIDPDNEIASVLMADIAFRKVDFDMSVFHFTQLVNKQPTNWTALIRLVEVMRRTGNLEDFPQYLHQAETCCERGREPGLSFCTGLYQWYSGNLNGALRSFNNARQDPEWGQMAIYNMIEICLNPEDEMLGEQIIDSEDFEYRDARSMALNTAQRLLKELKQKSNSLGEDSLKCRILGNFLLIATKEKYNIEQALEDFITLASHETYKEHVGPILGVATAYTMLKQNQRAKTQLKRVIKNVWTFEDAEYLERCWLLLADYYIQSNKYDLASDLLKRVLQHNKASYKAYEYMGFISEKEQKYKEAANCYESSWKFNGRNNPSIGYKLAYTLMKCKRFADAIDVGQQVLKAHPDYSKIKKDILDKSINNLRT